MSRHGAFRRKYKQAEKKFEKREASADWGYGLYVGNGIDAFEMMRVGAAESYENAVERIQAQIDEDEHKHNYSLENYYILKGLEIIESGNANDFYSKHGLL